MSNGAALDQAGLSLLHATDARENESRSLER
jgi:hypothetical protein